MKAKPKERYQGVFTSLGCLGEYHIILNEVHNSVANPLRHIPHSLKDKLKRTIEKHVQSVELVKVYEPTD